MNKTKRESSLRYCWDALVEAERLCASMIRRTGKPYQITPHYDGNDRLFYVISPSVRRFAT